MPETFDAYEYVSYLRRRWRFLLGTVLAAVVFALGVSLLLPKKYTATTRVLIEPPAGSDQRVATAVTPIYLESLRTYEHFASSDSLFLRALDHFGLRGFNPGKPIESWKQSVLQVEVPRSTKILEISATLPDATKAHAFALFLAEETVRLNRSVNLQGDQELVGGLERQAGEARTRLAAAEAEWAALVTREPVAGLEEEIRSAESLRAAIERDLVARDALGLSDEEAGARAERLRRRAAGLDREIAGKRKLFAERAARSQELQERVRSARESEAAAENRLREARAGVGYRGERLEIIDPGIVPERPSFPSLPLNAVVAMLLGAVVSLLTITLEFSYQRQKRASVRAYSSAHD